MMIFVGLNRSRHRDFSRSYDLLDSERANQRDERLDFFLVAGEFDGDRIASDIDQMRAEGADDQVEFRAGALVDRDLHHHHFAIDDVDALEIGDLDHRDQPVELLVDLLEYRVVSGRDEHDTRDRRIERILVDGERLNVKAAAREQTGHAGQHAEFVFDQYRYCVTWHSVVFERSWPNPRLSVPRDGLRVDARLPSVCLWRPA